VNFAGTTKDTAVCHGSAGSSARDALGGAGSNFSGSTGAHRGVMRKGRAADSISGAGDCLPRRPLNRPAPGYPGGQAGRGSHFPWRDGASLGEVRRDMARRNVTRTKRGTISEAGNSNASPGWARLGTAGHGCPRPGNSATQSGIWGNFSRQIRDRHGSAGPGVARQQRHRGR